MVVSGDGHAGKTKWEREKISGFLIVREKGKSGIERIEKQLE